MTHGGQELRFQLSRTVVEGAPLVQAQRALQQLGHVGPEAQRVLHRVLLFREDVQVVGLQNDDFQRAHRRVLRPEDVLQQVGGTLDGLAHIHVGGNEAGVLVAGAGNHVGIMGNELIGEGVNGLALQPEQLHRGIGDQTAQLLLGDFPLAAQAEGGYAHSFQYDQRRQRVHLGGGDALFVAGQGDGEGTSGLLGRQGKGTHLRHSGGVPQQNGTGRKGSQRLPIAGDQLLKGRLAIRRDIQTKGRENGTGA